MNDLWIGNLVTPDKMQSDDDTGLVHKAVANSLFCALPTWTV